MPCRHHLPRWEARSLQTDWADWKSPCLPHTLSRDRAPADRVNRLEISVSPALCSVVCFRLWGLAWECLPRMSILNGKFTCSELSKTNNKSVSLPKYMHMHLYDRLTYPHTHTFTCSCTCNPSCVASLWNLSNSNYWTHNFYATWNIRELKSMTFESVGFSLFLHSWPCKFLQYSQVSFQVNIPFASHHLIDPCFIYNLKYIFSFKNQHTHRSNN